MPKEKRDGLSACFTFIMDFSSITVFYNAVSKIELARATLVMKSVRSSERSAQLYKTAQCTELERNVQ